jgi:hypothetical protein
MVTCALLSGCGASSSGSDSSPSPTGTTFATLAAQGLVTQAEVIGIAGPGFLPYVSQVTASATDPKECLPLLLMSDGTRTAPPSSVSAATESFSDASTGSSITNTVHVFADAATASTTLTTLRGLVPRCSSFSVVVQSRVMTGAIVALALPTVGRTSLAVTVTITGPTTKADVTTVIAVAGRSLVVAVAGTPDGRDEASYATRTATTSATKAAAIG